ncbi:MAG: tetratricopeptide repeat protein [Bacteroidetes bacterium]|jgi:tetratricopeptide (TPR) repeat protein|nr:tetratricopeptide repeat protein [Bacteroidota bacterium]
MIRLTRHICLLLVLFACAGLHAQNDIARGDSLKKAGNYSAALKCYLRALKEDSVKNDRKALCNDYGKIAGVYINMGQYDKSTAASFNALRIAEELNDKKAIAVTNYGIGMNYATLARWDNALGFLNKAISLFTELKDTNGLANSYMVVSSLYSVKKDYEKALSYLKQSEQLFIAVNDKNSLADTYVNVSFMELERGNMDLVIEYARKALRLFKEAGDRPGMATAYINLQVARYYMHKGPKAPGYKQRVQECIALLDSAGLAVKDIESPEYFLHIYQNKAEIYGQSGQYDSAYAYQQKYGVLQDSLYNADKNEQIEELKIRYEAEKKEQNIALLEKENALLVSNSERKTFLGITILAGAGFIITVLLLIVVRNRSRKKQEQIELEKSILEFEQQALRAQMNPHFIFNAINSIQKYILKKNQQEAYDYLAKFARLIRIVLHNSREKALPLHQELEMIKLYVELEQLRFNNKFEFNLQVDESVNEAEVTVPAMLIQPYIENAIWHGLMNLEEERKGILTVDVSQSDGMLRICITDNGIGRARAKQYRQEDKHRSVGMALTEQRLLMINKMQEYGTARVVITDPEEGTKVEIFLPLHGN